MPSNLMLADSQFPRLDQGENTEQSIFKLQNYLYMLVEQLRYSLHNLDLSNLNHEAWEEMKLEISKPVYVSLKNAEGRMAQLELTASGLSSTVENLNTGMGHTLRLDKTGVYITDAKGNIVTISGGQIDANTVVASRLLGGSVSLLNASKTPAGVMSITGSTTSDFAVDLTSYGALRFLADEGAVYLGAYAKGGIAGRPALSLVQEDMPSVTGYVTMNIVGVQCDTLCPRQSSVANLGHPYLGVWQTLFADNCSACSSDRNAKNSIEDLPEKYVNFILWLAPKRFKLNNGTSGRYHVGFVAQDVEEGMALFGIDSLEFGGWIKDTGADGKAIYMLRYEEFIAILLAAVQDHENRLKRLEGTA